MIKEKTKQKLLKIVHFLYIIFCIYIAYKLLCLDIKLTILDIVIIFIWYMAMLKIYIVDKKLFDKLEEKK